MRRRRRVTLSILAIGLAVAGFFVSDQLVLWMYAGSAGDGVFQVKPYLQLGDVPTPKPGQPESLALVWQAADVDARWSVEVRGDERSPWVKVEPPSERRIAIDGLAPFRIDTATLSGLAPGAPFSYRVLHDDKLVFEASATARKPPGRPHRVVVFGDCAAGTLEQRRVAYQAYLARPDYVVVTGDIVYARGRVSEYLANYFPVYNSDKASPLLGAPLVRSTVVLAAPGNHDLVEGDFDRIPDAFAYFYYWDVPQNGPITNPVAAGAPRLKGAENRRRAFLKAAGPAFPRSANYAFDYGDVHWTILDANPHVDWTTPALRDWLAADLAAAKDKPWRFVAFHHPAFSSSKAHFDDQRMRVLAPVFEAGKVAVVFTGHVHNYQRSYPLKFAPALQPDGKTYGPDGRVDGQWTLDKTFDGATQTRPEGVIYLVTGAGGAKLYDSKQESDRASWQPYTLRFTSHVHSITIADVAPDSVTIRQVSAEDEELDRFVVTRPSSVD